MKRLLLSALILASTPALAESANAAWRKIVQQQAELSLQQTPNQKPVTRFCEAETKTCTRVIFAKRGEQQTMVAEIENVDEKLIARTICKINDSGDIRTCVDFDRGTTTKAIYDSGHWHNVGGK